MTRVNGWRCDTCKRVDKERPWECVSCKKEICEHCFWSYGHCRACAEGKSDAAMAIAANATGDFDFEFPKQGN